MRQFKELNEEEQQIAMMLGFSHMLATRENLQAAYDYRNSIIQSAGSNEIAIITGNMVAHNTLILAILDKYNVTVKVPTN